jgi:hypothetical protein
MLSLNILVQGSFDNSKTESYVKSLQMDGRYVRDVWWYVPPSYHPFSWSIYPPTNTEELCRKLVRSLKITAVVPQSGYCLVLWYISSRIFVQIWMRHRRRIVYIYTHRSAVKAIICTMNTCCDFWYQLCQNETAMFGTYVSFRPFPRD